ALVVVAIALFTGIYFAFLRTPGPETLYGQAETLLKSEPREAREGPIALFLATYPQHEKASQVRKWADQYDFEARDRQMHSRRNRKFSPDGPEEKLANEALDDEKIGRLADAARRWKELGAKKGNGDPDLHAWGLVGEHYAQELQKVEDTYVDLRKWIDR